MSSSLRATRSTSRVGRSVVEKLECGGRKDFVAENRVVRQARQNGQTGLWTSGTVPSAVALTSTQQREELYGMRGRKDVAVAGDDECRRGDAANLLGEIERLFHRLADLFEQPGPILRTRRDGGVQLVHRRLLHELRRGGVD